MRPNTDLQKDDPRGNRRYRRLLALASASLFWEQLWPRLWPAACVAGAFLALALLDVLPMFPGWLHTAVLSLFTAGFVAAGIWARPGFRKIPSSAARGRLERDNDLSDHPLVALEDRLAAGSDDPLAEALWRRHRERMAAMIRRLRVRLPRPGLARHDPLGLRAGVLLMLVLGLIAAGPDGGGRLWRAVDPGLGSGRPPPTVEIWITPPAYTGVAPMFFSAGTPLQQSGAAAAAASPIHVPRGSAALVRAAGIRRAPVLVVGAASAPFVGLTSEDDGKQAWHAETVIDDGDRILVRAGRRALAEWPIQVLADAPPTAAFGEPPRDEGQGLLSLSYAAQDDYGVTELTATIEAADERARSENEDGVIRIPLPLATAGASSLQGRGLRDLSDEPLAGLPVKIYLAARDAAGQTGRSASVEVVLPERSFAHPVARAIVGLRKRLSNPRDRLAVANDLGGIASRPEAFGKDTLVSLALAVSSSRLRLDQGEDAIRTVRDLLWQTALRIEQGDLPFAERRLEDARRRLTEALQAGVSQAEIERLMGELQDALGSYLAAAAEEVARRGDGPTLPDGEAAMLRSDDLKDLIEMARQMSRTGSREGALKMLAQLQQALDGIRSGLRSGNAGQQFAAARKLINDLRELSDRQQGLLEQTFEQLRDSRASPQRGSGEGQGQRQRRSSSRPTGDEGNAAQQQELRRELGEVMLEMNGFFGSIPDPLGQADQAMGGAVEALRRGMLGDGLSDQTEAADALARALDATQAMVAQRLGGMMSLSGENGPGGNGSNDIFGRSADGQRGLGTGPLTIPERAQLQRAHEILEELRRRAAERFRPRPELDYIDRLLRRF